MKWAESGVKNGAGELVVNSIDTDGVRRGFDAEMLEAIASVADVPIIATGGKTGESILRTIESGANAITYTPPSTYELFQEMMKGYRE